jgi:3-methyladenine DNA glycosylase AlkD
MTAPDALLRLQALANEDTARVLQRFFKTGPNGYGAGDVFLGIKVGPLRQLAREFQRLPLAETETLLQSDYHEARLLALLVLVRQFQRGDVVVRKTIYQLYLRRTAHVNNWDLVDTSAEHLVGGWLWERSRKPLVRLARSASLWKRRIAMVATYHFIKRGDHGDTLQIARLLLNDCEDLIHKAVGWMLREVGKRDQKVEEEFLAEHYRAMPRTMLRYAIERFPEPLRLKYLKGEV